MTGVQTCALPIFPGEALGEIHAIAAAPLPGEALGEEHAMAAAPLQLLSNRLARRVAGSSHRQGSRKSCESSESSALHGFSDLESLKVRRVNKFRELGS